MTITYLAHIEWDMFPKPNSGKQGKHGKQSGNMKPNKKIKDLILSERVLGKDFLKVYFLQQGNQ